MPATGYGALEQYSSAVGGDSTKIQLTRMMAAILWLMNAGRRRMLMNPPGATDVLSISGLDGRTERMAEAAAMGLSGPPADPCARE